MTLDELKKEYGEENVFENQFEMGKCVQEYGIRNKIKYIEERYPNEKVKKDSELFYNLAEALLSKNIAFYNDGFYVVEDFEELKDL